jgi:hypothetical protein
MVARQSPDFEITDIRGHKVLVLQKYYGFSDEETEFQIMDRFSFLQFLGLQAGDDVPDARTIWDFKQLLEKKTLVIPHTTAIADVLHKEEVALCSVAG